ncbi:Uncharacterised protein [Chlamydia trachomatis]|nr:Uncharacterised protein [Chlamydia trachomatis]
MKRINISLVMEMSNSVSSNNPEQIEAKTKKKNGIYVHLCVV